jgi:hypothetical protein
MPRATISPPLETALSEVPSPTDRLDVPSGGEGGTTVEHCDAGFLLVDRPERPSSADDEGFAMTSEAREIAS